jgi:hypothetical protein
MCGTHFTKWQQQLSEKLPTNRCIADTIEKIMKMLNKDLCKVDTHKTGIENQQYLQVMTFPVVPTNTGQI